MKFLPGCSCCGPCGSVCITVRGCVDTDAGGWFPVPWATVTVSKTGFSQVGTLTTTVVGATVKQDGFGYTSPPSVTISGGGGSGATATATVVSGRVIAVTIVSGGSGYTSRPTISFSGGGGTGASALAKLGTSCCVDVPSTGTYTVTVVADRFATSTSSVTVSTCPSTANATITLGPDSDHVCCSRCITPLPKTLYLTDSNGTHTLLYDGVLNQGWIVSYNITTTVGTGPSGDECASEGSGTVGIHYFFRCDLPSFDLQIQYAVRCCNEIPGRATDTRVLYLPGQDGGAQHLDSAVVQDPGSCDDISSLTFGFPDGPTNFCTNPAPVPVTGSVVISE